MIVQLRDRQEIHVTKEQAYKIKEAITADVKGIELADQWFRADYIVRIKPGGEQTAAAREDRQIQAPDYRGENSDAKERIRQALLNKEMKSLA